MRRCREVRSLLLLRLCPQRVRSGVHNLASQKAGTDDEIWAVAVLCAYPSDVGEVAESFVARIWLRCAKRPLLANIRCGPYSARCAT